MRAVIVVETIFGGTLRVARCVTDGLSEHCHAELMRVDSAASQGLPAADLLVVGAPTHAHGLSTADSRQSAALLATDPFAGLQLEASAAQVGVREWMDGLHASDVPRLYAAFDTRLKGLRVITGAASVQIDRRLQQLGSVPAVPPMSFLVGIDHALIDGELERAEGWGRHLVAVATDLLGDTRK